MYNTGNCTAIRVEVLGATPEDLDRNALNLAKQFFGDPPSAIKHLFKFTIQPYVAEASEVVRDADGAFVRVAEWTATVTVTFGDTRLKIGGSL